MTGKTGEEWLTIDDDLRRQLEGVLEQEEQYRGELAQRMKENAAKVPVNALVLAGMEIEMTVLCRHIDSLRKWLREGKAPEHWFML